jgi:hypothetical protein
MSETVGGFGGRNARQKRRRRLVGRALQEYWAIPREVRTALIKRLCEIVEDRGVGPREATAAGRALLAASKVNLDHVSVTIKANMHEEIRGQLAAVQRRLEEHADR